MCECLRQLIITGMYLSAVVFTLTGIFHIKRELSNIGWPAVRTNTGMHSSVKDSSKLDSGRDNTGPFPPLSLYVTLVCS